MFLSLSCHREIRNLDEVTSWKRFTGMICKEMKIKSRWRQVSCKLLTVRYGPSPRVSRYFWIRNFFFPDSKISPSTRGVFKYNAPVLRIRWYPNSLVVLPFWYCSETEDGTRFCYVVGIQNIRNPPSTRYRIRCGVIFSHAREWIQKCPNSPDACGRKPHLERKSCGIKNIRISVDGAIVYLFVSLMLLTRLNFA